MITNTTESSLPLRSHGMDQELIWHPYTRNHDAQNICIVKGKGEFLYDESGRAYLDMVSSWWTNLHGHSHPYIAEKIALQAQTLEHVIFAGFTHPSAIILAERLLRHLPSNQKKIFYSDNGSTSVEVAIKMALQFWYNGNEKKQKVVAFRNAYHGDTFGAMSSSGRGIFTKPFSDLLFDVVFIAPPVKDMEMQSIHELRSAISSYGSEIAAFIFEPLVQGAAGMITHEAESLNELLAVCKQNNVLTIADEVMTGFGRTGKFFASDYLHEKPDIICLSKGLTGGFMPMAVTSCTEDIFNAFLADADSTIDKSFYHGHSYTANPLGCAAALASFDLMEQNTTWQRIDRIVSAHAAFKNKIINEPKVNEVRQCGTILAIELKTEEDTSYTNTIRDSAYKFFLDKGIVMRPLGNVIYMMPPYCTSESQLNEVYSVILEFLHQ